MNKGDLLWEDLGEFARFVAPLEAAIGYEFKDKKLLREALTSDMFWRETVVHFDKAVSHGSLALLGDVLLQYLAVRWAYQQNKDKHLLLRIKGALGETNMLAALADKFNMREFVISQDSLAGVSGKSYKSRAHFFATILEALVGAWSLDDPSLKSLNAFLERHLFSQEVVQEDLDLFGFTFAEMERLRAAYSSSGIKNAKGYVFKRLGSAFHMEPRIRIGEKRIRHGLPEYRAVFTLGGHELVSEWGRTRGVAQRYALFRCALKLLDGDEWIRQQLDSCTLQDGIGEYGLHRRHTFSSKD